MSREHEALGNISGLADQARKGILETFRRIAPEYSGALADNSDHLDCNQLVGLFSALDAIDTIRDEVEEILKPIEGAEPKAEQPAPLAERVDRTGSLKRRSRKGVGRAK